MRATASHEMSYGNCLNSNAYIATREGPWKSDCNLLVDVHSLCKSPNVALNFSINVSKLFNNGN
jgi:hypothetical protein